MTNNDENKVFGITFRTPPASSNGIAHIMEHSVLCGSRKYRVKEPFIELSKGSLNTFLNAMTYPDKTTYPVASTNLQDFYNLVDVYLDAVFHPLIPELTLQQEGWHYELESPDAPLTFKGVVFNEMKGDYSSPDNLLNEHSQHSIFPDNTYGFDSGGDPLAIPDLTYEQFKRFHADFYHPSNAYIWFYGDDPEEERFRILEPWLDEFERQEPGSEIPLQSRFSRAAPGGASVRFGRDAKTPSPTSPSTGCWTRTPTPRHPSACAILGHILTGTPASPLRKALMESGLGEDLTGSDFSENFRQMTLLHRHERREARQTWTRWKR